MPSAGLIRQRLLGILGDVVIPDIQINGVTNLLTALLPFDSTENIAVRSLPLPSTVEKKSSVSYPIGRHWDQAGVHALGLPVLKCVVEGEFDQRIGVTNAMQNLAGPPHNLSEIHVLSMTSPSYLLIPPHIPQSSGAFSAWERDTPHQGTSISLNLRVLPIGALCHITAMQDGIMKPQYSLLIEDDFLISMMELIIDEFGSSPVQSEIVQHQLLALLLRVKKGLQSSDLVMTDGLYSRFPARPVMEDSQTHQVSVMNKAGSFIQLHLNEPLSPTTIARHVRLKPAQLNRIFRQESNLSVMQYVAKQRIQTARLLLQTSELPVQEIGQLVGFKYSSHFSRAFQDYTGVSPLKFRQQQAESHHSTDA